MKYLLKNGLLLIDESWERKDILIENGKISKISESIDTDGEVINCENLYISPGFIDIHTHGADGVDVNDADLDGVEKIRKFFVKYGVTSFLASILTDTEEQTEKMIRVLTEAMDRESEGAKLFGIHLEGPFLNSLFKGAMPESLLKSGDLDLVKHYQKIAKGKIKYITIAPELEGNTEMIKGLKDLGIVVALGHSNATYDETMKAIDEGAESITHLMNAMRQIHQHEIGIAGATLISDKVYAEVISDGLHLKSPTVKLIEKNKTLDKMIAITDCIMATGLPDGDYKLGINDVVVVDGDAKLKENGVRAGSTLTLDRALKNISKFTEKPIKEVIKTMTYNPRKLFKIEDRGIIEEGKCADLTIFNEDVEIQMTLVDGEIKYRRSL